MDTNEEEDQDLWKQINSLISQKKKENEALKNLIDAMDSIEKQNKLKQAKDSGKENH